MPAKFNPVYDHPSLKHVRRREQNGGEWKTFSYTYLISSSQLSITEPRFKSLYLTRLLVL